MRLKSTPPSDRCRATHVPLARVMKSLSADRSIPAAYAITTPTNTAKTAAATPSHFLFERDGREPLSRNRLGKG
jgi:hypothetical protein